MTRFIQAHLAGSSGEPPGRGVLKPETLKLMRQPHASQMGTDIWGLGTMLYVPNGQGDFIIGHDGKPQPAINSAVRLNPSTGDVFWQTGTIDFLMFTLVAKKMITTILIGWGVIILTALFIGWRRSRGRRIRAAQGKA